MAPRKTSVSEIYTHIFEDLDFVWIARIVCCAIGWRACYDVGCQSFEARLLLTRASELNDKALYEQAYTLAKEVIDNGPLSYQRILPQYLIWKILMEMAIRK